jgi:hypothetical protein
LAGTDSSEPGLDKLRQTTVNAIDEYHILTVAYRQNGIVPPGKEVRRDL